MVLAVTFYSVILFFHILAVVLAFGPTFAYGVFAATAERMDPRSVPAVAAGILAWNRITQGMILIASSSPASTWSRRPGGSAGPGNSATSSSAGASSP